MKVRIVVKLIEPGLGHTQAYIKSYGVEDGQAVEFDYCDLAGEAIVLDSDLDREAIALIGASLLTFPWGDDFQVVGGYVEPL